MRQRYCIASSLLWALLIIRSAEAYEGSNFEEVAQKIFQTPYSELPVYKINRDLFGPAKPIESNNVLTAAKRTLSIQDDLISFPQGQKLLNANGICFKGIWHIDEESPFTGQFSSGTRSLVLLRASVALDGTLQKHKRAFGMAIKIFPTVDPYHTVKTLNAFVLHTMSGVRSKHILDLELDNKPAIGGLPPLSKIGVALRLKRDLENADKFFGASKANAAFRPVTHLAAVSNVSGISEELNSPRLLRLRVAPGTPRIDADDFRDEMRLHHYPGRKLVWTIYVSTNDNKVKKNIVWQSIGRIILDESVTSTACDQELHFAHPKID